MAIVQKELFASDENAESKSSTPNLLEMKDARQIYESIRAAGIPKRAIDRNFMRASQGEKNEGFEVTSDLTFSDFLFGYREIYQKILHYMSEGLSYEEAARKYDQIDVEQYSQEIQMRTNELMKRKKS